jgi:type IV secretory pathway TrbD component
VFVVGFHIVTLILAAVWVTAVHTIMVWVAKQDPQMVELYIRSLSGRDYYAPHARAHAPTPAPRLSIPSTR